MNDRPDIALLVGAGGVHVGQDDLGVEQARAIVGHERWVGVSTHTLEQVDAADRTSADYVAFGPVFATATKEHPTRSSACGFSPRPGTHAQASGGHRRHHARTRGGDLSGRRRFAGRGARSGCRARSGDAGPGFSEGGCAGWPHGFQGKQLRVCEGAWRTCRKVPRPFCPRRVNMANQLFMTKPHSVLLEELRGEQRLRRVLGPVHLSSLGVGAIIGTGIFVLTGVAAHDRTGPALMLSFVVAGVTCIFAALCYAEFASMVPVAGSAYTYAYATLGELFAWIIGWDLILEYAVASATVAHGWSHYFQDFLAYFDLHCR